MLALSLRILGHDVMFTPAVGLPKSEAIRGFQRARYANHNGGDLFVSIHCNASENHNGKGCEVWYYSQKELATKLVHAISLHNTNRGAKYSDQFSVLVKTVMPAVLVELAFIDNDTDCQWLMKHWPEQVGRMAAVIHQWVQEQE